jgi:hypothetical protein
MLDGTATVRESGRVAGAEGEQAAKAGLQLQLAGPAQQPWTRTAVVCVLQFLADLCTVGR